MPGALRFIRSVAGVQVVIDDQRSSLFKIIDLASDKVLFTTATPKSNFPPRAEPSIDGTRVAVQTADPQHDPMPHCLIIDAATGRNIRTVPLEKGLAIAGLSERGEYLALQGHDDNHLEILDVQSGRKIVSIPDMASLDPEFLP